MDVKEKLVKKIQKAITLQNIGKEERMPLFLSAEELDIINSSLEK